MITREAYNIFRNMNMSSEASVRKTSKILRILGQPIRILILHAIGKGEACVCHLKKLLKKRQAFISQHLMAMREAGILETRRDGRYVFYRVKDLHVFDLIGFASSMAGLQEGSIGLAMREESVPGCECPQCAPQEGPQAINVEGTSLS